ncbi:MAG: hypothetical protein ABIH20_05575 [Candidatus Diapherotrites archaeon]
MLVVDASTLILLAKTELLDLFIELNPNRMVISQEVKNEATRKKSFDASLIKKRITDGKIILKKPKNKKTTERIMKDFNLHKGEAETIALCLEMNYKGIATDDYAAMKACTVLEIKYISSLAILLKLAEKKMLDSQQANLKLENLEHYGRYSKEIIEDFREKLRRCK